MSGASNFCNFKHFKQLFMILSRLCLLTMWELPRRVSCFVSSLLKNYFSCFIQDFRSSPSFMPSKASFLHDHLITQHSDFHSFLAVSSTDKPINRSIHAYAPTWRNVFALRGFIFRDIHKKQGRSSSNSGYRIQKICGWKIYSRTRTFGAEVHKSNIRVKR